MTGVILSASVTHRGLLREGNEDSILVGGMVYQGPAIVPSLTREKHVPLLFAVADGIGGSAAGEVASRTVLTSLSRDPSIPVDPAALTGAVGRAKEELDQIAKADRSLTGLGTTVAGLIIAPGCAISFNCGDSRVYRITPERCERLSHDHSLVQELCDCGVISNEQVNTHPYRHIITSSVSGDLTGREPLVHTNTITLRPFDRFLLCTDGVWEITRERQIIEFVTIPDLAQAAASLLTHCLNAGAPDNVSFIIVAVE